jgi:hypothetical protein
MRRVGKVDSGPGGYESQRQRQETRDKGRESEERGVTEPEREPSDTTVGETPAERGVARFVTGLLIGALVGAGVALLFAPARGERVRRRLGRGARALRDRARDELEHVARRARREIERRR